MLLRTASVQKNWKKGYTIADPEQQNEDNMPG